MVVTTFFRNCVFLPIAINNIVNTLPQLKSNACMHADSRVRLHSGSVPMSWLQSRAARTQLQSICVLWEGNNLCSVTGIHLLQESFPHYLLIEDL